MLMSSINTNLELSYTAIKGTLQKLVPDTIKHISVTIEMKFTWGDAHVVSMGSEARKILPTIFDSKQFSLSQLETHYNSQVQNPIHFSFANPDIFSVFPLDKMEKRSKSLTYFPFYPVRTFFDMNKMNNFSVRTQTMDKIHGSPKMSQNKRTSAIFSRSFEYL